MAKRPRSPDTPAARRIKRKILVAIALTAFLPMLVVAYLLYSYALPLLDPQIQERDLPWMMVMLAGSVPALGTGPRLGCGSSCRPPACGWPRAASSSGI